MVFVLQLHIFLYRFQQKMREYAPYFTTSNDKIITDTLTKRQIRRYTVKHFWENSYTRPLKRWLGQGSANVQAPRLCQYWLGSWTEMAAENAQQCYRSMGCKRTSKILFVENLGKV